MLRTLRRSVVLMVVVGCAASAGPARAAVCGTPLSYGLIAGQHFTAGTISVYNDATNIYVKYDAVAPWLVSDAHVAVANALAGIPQTKTGNPIPGRFAYSATFDPEVTTYTFAIPYVGLFAPHDSLFVAAHAVVQAPREQGGSQTAWGEGPGFPGNNWAMYLSYTLQSCGGDEGNA
ncbi:MAG: hypothetical protein AB7N65_20425 [Vicinamibacterales bacterium]